MIRCGKCERDLPEDAFGVKRYGGKRPDKRQPYCKECNRAYQRDHYQRNSGKYKESAAAWKKQRRIDLILLVQAYLADHPCVDCGEDDAVVLQFDHVRGQKISSVAHMVWRLRPWADIEAEIAKCDVRCANCHTRRTAAQFGWWKAANPDGVDEELVALEA